MTTTMKTNLQRGAMPHPTLYTMTNQRTTTGGPVAARVTRHHDRVQIQWYYFTDSTLQEHYTRNEDIRFADEPDLQSLYSDGFWDIEALSDLLNCEEATEQV